MIGIAMYTTIITLHKQGVSQRQISKITKKDRKTIKRIISKYKNHNIEEPTVYQRISKASAFHIQIISLLERRLTNVRIYEEVQQMGYDGSYSALNRYIKKYNIKQNTCIRFHTRTGEEAQVDFGDIGMRYDENMVLRKAYVFNMRLSYSRLDYYEVVFDQKVDTWLNCHINAFNYFSGVPEVIKLDNLKSAVIDPAFYEPIYQKHYKRLADHYNFLPSPCRVYQPQEKGKVESGIKYVKNNFFAGRIFDNYKTMQNQLATWIEKANDRIHGTTREKPNELFLSSEKSMLSQLPQEQFSMIDYQLRKVAKDCHISLDNNYYSVPAKYVGDKVEVSVSNNLVKIYSNNNLIVTHVHSTSKGVFITNVKHYAKNKRYCPGFEEYDTKHQNDLKQMGKYCELMLAYLQKEHKRNWYRAANGILSLRKIYSDEMIDQACKRALCFGISSYSKIKKILDSNSHKLPLAGGYDAITA